jgi:predicted Zn-dependent protease
MKKTSVFVVILLMCAITAAIAAPADYTIQVPAGWTKNAGSAAREQYMKDGISFILTVDTAPAGVKTPDQFVEYVKKQLAGAFKNTKFETVKKITVNGRDARELLYTGEISGIKMQYDVVYVPNGEKYYTLTFGGMQNMFGGVRADIKAIVNSFKLK